MTRQCSPHFNLLLFLPARHFGSLFYGITKVVAAFLLVVSRKLMTWPEARIGICL
ncbi:hypothetical protein yrohd0001_25340 [Yersinia rohdei ATCC 43380]|nr:hypothetical protein yrohd0001_25340 [Yersinia rohdei ATCC 43380]